MDFLNFLIYNNYFPNKQDPTFHRIKEKRRRDRMNDSLAEISRLIPANYVKQVKLKRLRLSKHTEMIMFYFSDIYARTLTTSLLIYVVIMKSSLVEIVQNVSVLSILA